MNRPIFCRRCGAPWGERALLVPGDVTRTIPTPDGDLEVVLLDHPTVVECLEMLRRILEDEKTRAREVDRRIQMVMARHNALVEETKNSKKANVERH